MIHYTLASSNVLFKTLFDEASIPNTHIYICTIIKMKRTRSCTLRIFFKKTLGNNICSCLNQNIRILSVCLYVCFKIKRKLLNEFKKSSHCSKAQSPT